MRLSLGFLILFLSLNISAGSSINAANTDGTNDVFVVPSFKVDIKADQVIRKIHQVIASPNGILNRYTPVGGTYKNKVVENNSVSFIMTKKVLIITKTFKVHFEVDVHEEANLCASNQIGIKYNVDLKDSDSLVTDNIDRLEFNICIAEINSGVAQATINGQIFKGDRFSEPVGTIAKNTIQDQVDPFVKAIKDEVMESLIK